MTVTFRELAELRSRSVVMTLDIALPGKTIYLSDRAVTITNQYEAVISSWGDSRLSASGDAGITKTSDFEFTVAKRKLGFQALGQNFDDLFATYLFFNAPVTVKFHLIQPDGTYLTAQHYRGLIDRIKVAPQGFKFTVISDQSYNKAFPPTMFRKEDTGMGRLPDNVIGTPIPVIYGDWWNTPGINIIEADIEFVGITRNVVPAILYDPVDDTTKCHNYRICSHALHTLNGAAQNAAPFLYEHGNGISSLTDSVDSWVNNAAGSDVKLKRPIYAYAFIQPAKDAASTCTNPLNARDRDETTYATLDYNKTLILEMEPIPNAGEIVEVYVDGIVQRVVNSDKSIEIGLTTSDIAEYAVAWPLTTDDPTYIHTAAVTTAALRNWDCLQASGNPIKVFIKYELGATVGQAKVQELCLCFKYRPSGMKGGDVYYPDPMKRPGRYAGSPADQLRWFLNPPKFEQTAFNQGVFANCKGHPDDGGGTYTGTGGLLVGNPADIIHHLLCIYGGATSGQIVTSGFGSFITARTELNARVTGDFNIRFRWTQRCDLKAVIEKICNQCGLTYIEPCIDDKHRLVAWKATPSGDDYEFRATADGGLVSFGWGWSYGIIRGSFSCEPTNRDDIANEVYVNYFHDFTTESLTKLVYIDGTTSYPNDDTREAICLASQSDYGVVNRLTVDADMHYLETTATWLRDWVVDTKANERINLTFEASMLAYDLLPRHVFGTLASIDSHIKYPLKGGNRSWASKKFWCTDVNRMRDPKSAMRISVKGISI
jgi:hypothetical protein